MLRSRKTLPSILFAISIVFATGACDIAISKALSKIGVRTVDNRLEVVDEISGVVLHNLKKPEGVVREMFALAEGEVVVTTQEKFSDFWNAATGEKIRRYAERIYAYSHDQKTLVTFSGDNDPRVALRSSADMTVKFILPFDFDWGPAALLFSPDDRYLAVEYCDAYPLSDVLFLNPVIDASTRISTLYDLNKGERIQTVDGGSIGHFSDDSVMYILEDGRRFDLQSRRIIP